MSNIAILDVLQQLQKAVEDIGNSYGPAAQEKLIGHFDRIEETQNKILSKIAEIEKIIYEPDEGIFSRIKNAEAKHQEKIHSLDKDLAELQSNQENSIYATDQGYLELIKDVGELKKWKSTWTKIVWVMLVPSAGTGILKIIFDFFSSHIQIK